MAKRRVSRRVSKKVSRKRSRSPKKRSRRTSKKSSRRTSKKRSFGTKVVLEDGTELTDHPSMNMSHRAEMQDSRYKKYLIKVNKKLHQLNDSIKKNHIVVTFGSFLLLLFILMYTSYDDIKTKSVNELMYGVYTYLIGGSLLGQYAIKDAFYELISKIRTALTYDHEFHEIKDNFMKLKEAKLVDDKMDRLFRNIEADYSDISTSPRPSTTSKQEMANLKSFMQLLIDLTASHHEEMNTVLPDDYITDIIAKLEEFMKDYGSAAKQLDRELVNPLLLNMIGKEGPPVSAIFLVGRPGVGKTRFVQHLAKILHAKVYEFLPPAKGDIGRINFFAKSAKEQYPNLSVFTRMTLDAKENKGKPMILFIDEIDKKLNKELLTTLLDLLGDPKSRKMADPGLNITVKLPKNIVVVCASNKTLELIVEENKKYEPLLSRFVEIFIPDMAKEVQLKATTDYIKSIYPQLTKEDETFISDVVYRTTFPGMRELINISNTYVRQLQAITALQKYKTVETPAEFRENYIKQLEEQEAARNAAAEIKSKTGAKYAKYSDEGSTSTGGEEEEEEDDEE